MATRLEVDSSCKRFGRPDEERERRRTSRLSGRSPTSTYTRRHVRFFRKILEYPRTFPRANFKGTINATRVPGH